MNFENHPCFNESARHKYGRVHLPVAPRCNIHCNYCNRKYDCVNESRPGVTSVVLSPKQSLFYLEKVIEKHGNISVVGIAGPGDPFANPVETLETFRLIRAKYPDLLLCVSTNGLNVSEYVPELAKLKTSHVTITLNAVDPVIGAKIYGSIRYNERVYYGVEAARILLERQLAAIKKLKEYGIIVKVNSVFVPGINDAHLLEVAKKAKSLGASILNIIPLLPAHGTVFENIAEPEAGQLVKLKLAAREYLPLMNHCGRCRADAAGLINEKVRNEIIELLAEASQKEENKNHGRIYSISKDLIAIASQDGIHINEHLGRMAEAFIYKINEGIPYFLEKREIPLVFGVEKWKKYKEILKDCEAILTSQAGSFPVKILAIHGINVVVTEGTIKTALKDYLNSKKLPETSYRRCTGCEL